MGSKPLSASKYRRSLYHQHEELISSLSGARALVSHAGEKGEEIEGTIRNALDRVLPEKVGVSHGFVIDSNGSESKQMDIVLYDKMNTPKIYTGDRVQIFPVESTYACGEVKTKLDSQSLKDSFAKCLSYKNLQRNAYIVASSPVELSYVLFGENNTHWKSIFFCIAYETVALENLCSLGMSEHDRLPLDKRIDTIVVLNNPGNASNMIANAVCGPVSGGITELSVRLISDKESSNFALPANSPWAMFVALLLHYMVQAPSEIVDMLQYNTGERF